MDISPGLRVVRGPDWEWGEQDGGEGHVGTVIEVHIDSSADDKGASGSVSGKDDEESGSSCQSVTVLWDSGVICRCRCGEEGKYDLRVFDSAQTGQKHPSVTCDDCHEHPLIGIRWKCGKCYDYDLCTSCYMSGKHSLDHKFTRHDTRSTTVILPPRHGVGKVEAWGMFTGAQVMRGHDWSWGQQDGGDGRTGKVVDIGEWGDDNGNTYRTAIEVEWAATKEKNEYQVGHKGKVDLKCTEPVSGGHYYPDHLPCLGATPPSFDPHQIVTADYVKVELDIDVFQLMQEGHGGWSLQMAMLRNRLAVVHSINNSGDLVVLYGESKCTLNPSAVVKVDIPTFASGDVVRVMDDMVEVRKMQQDHGGWNEEMSLTIGHLGIVQGVTTSGNVLTAVKGHLWHYNPLCLKLANDESPPDVDNSDMLGLGEGIVLQVRMRALLEEEDSKVLLYAALLGNTTVIADYLQKFPNEVNARFDGKGAIHCAAIAGKIPVLEVLLDFRANLELKDDTGRVALHHCALKNRKEAAKFLLDAGAEPNAAGQTQETPLIIAAAKGNGQVLEVLAKHPKINFSAQDSDGDTALHCAIFARNHNCASLLLDAGADVTLINFKLLTPLHLATTLSFFAAVELMVTRYPQHINLKNDEGATALHLAAHNDHRDILNVLLQQESCNIDALTDNLYTPLHAAVIKGYTKIIERLVGYGAKLDAMDSDGDTPLHLTLDRATMQAPTDHTPEIKKLEEKLSKQNGCSPQVIVACFLVQEGADIHAVNKVGLTPLQGDCPPSAAAIIRQFATSNAGSGTYHHSLTKSPSKPSNNEQPDNHNEQERQVPATAPSPGTPGSSIRSASPLPTPSSTQDVSATTQAPQTSGTISSLPPAQPSFGPSINKPLQTSTVRTGITEAGRDTQPPQASGDPQLPQPSDGPIVIPPLPTAQSSQSPQASGGPQPSQAIRPDTQSPQTSAITQPPQASEGPTSTSEEDDETACVICDTPTRVKFKPCGHAVLCRGCAEIVRRCPICKATVEALVPIT